MASKKSEKLRIGLFGFGVVGQGLFEVLQNVQTAEAVIKTICIKDPDKKRKADPNLFTLDPEQILNDPDINLVVELIDDADRAYEIVRSALTRGKSVVSGNKKMLAHHLNELIELQETFGAALLYDASACGSIPVIRNLEEYYDNDLLQSITGILNGSSNYILSRIFSDNMGYDEALAEAQALGFAESDPVFDVEGFDSLYKSVILALHGIGTLVDPDEVVNFGISNLSSHDVLFAKEKGCRIKLVAEIRKLPDEKFTFFVMPKLVWPDAYIFNVEDEYNGVVIEGQFYDKQFMFGKGAGGHPTGSAVLSDITARKHNYRYEYKKRNFFNPPYYSRDWVIEVYLRYHDVLDLSHFDFETITEKYSGPKFNYVIGRIKLEDIYRIKKLLPRLNVFLASTGK
ncbi:MAG: homoserine dehydrogenase [Bacteroidetes bacterium]|jgi:homoserine dehydrogenase|nr:homoserine dehydrogenase [Bacteroidota bacterium]MBT4402129.1 homoserine dehydrogenase [Bacteroidota bacterium]MBT4409332.1 homoserine dehydrogenase [Bacteroidota bacterium]MBT5426023.1 homoserine dehydrogenase [Bacteroidota bacterium]MBT7095382.1 homoserine dehydrogenase [Bacteroidota bacterium]